MAKVYKIVSLFDPVERNVMDSHETLKDSA